MSYSINDLFPKEIPKVYLIDKPKEFIRIVRTTPTVHNRSGSYKCIIDIYEDKNEMPIFEEIISIEKEKSALELKIEDLEAKITELEAKNAEKL